MSNDNPTVTQPSSAQARKRRLVPIKEACAYAKMSRTKMYGKINAEIVHAYRRDGETMIDLNTIDDMHEALERIVLHAKGAKTD